ncbi:uncharacterized protein CC84DRAFT_393722 [Paraphaeosphaeria sporulosa]|uniref:Uncharacterized protein n=1 Tax=Paraphaeosphaeria sporulosa TaxID=1460663 RepID=A0A177BY67_9PLEO|nr:uncharacterized protein CC84DRAFT_393722 [Paraphaeosphaeria sporulosa]OAF99346.1 hypothetical protein CC84DRAFT_393722 [Paraphaeosphaeria sporulosa]
MCVVTEATLPITQPCPPRQPAGPRPMPSRTQLANSRPARLSNLPNSNLSLPHAHGATKNSTSLGRRWGSAHAHRLPRLVAFNKRCTTRSTSCSPSPSHRSCSEPCSVTVPDCHKACRTAGAGPGGEHRQDGGFHARRTQEGDGRGGREGRTDANARDRHVGSRFARGWTSRAAGGKKRAELRPIASRPGKTCYTHGGIIAEVRCTCQLNANRARSR